MLAKGDYYSPLRRYMLYGQHLPISCGAVISLELGKSHLLFPDAPVYVPCKRSSYCHSSTVQAIDILLILMIK